MGLYFKVAIYMILFLLLNFVYAEEDESYETKICEKVANTNIPNEDLPTRKGYVKLNGCDPWDLYYGIGVPINYIKARKCALILGVMMQLLARK